MKKKAKASQQELIELRKIQKEYYEKVNTHDCERFEKRLSGEEGALEGEFECQLCGNSWESL